MEQDQHRTRSRAQVTHARPVEFHPALFHASVSRRRRKRRNSPRLVHHNKIFPSRRQLFHHRRSLFKRTSPLFVSLWGASAPRFLLEPFRSIVLPHCHPERSRWLVKRASCEVEGPLTRLRNHWPRKVFLPVLFVHQ